MFQGFYDSTHREKKVLLHMPTLTLGIAKLRHYRNKAKTGIGNSYMPLITEGLMVLEQAKKTGIT